MRRLLLTCFGLGRLPAAPGTWGSLPPVVIFGLMAYLGASPIAISIVMAALVLAGSVVCVKCSPDLIASTGKKDPQEIVADEFAGQAVTFLFISQLDFWEILSPTVIGFLLFRIFDIAKPWPIRKLEKLPNGWGILADDLLAGVYAGVVLLIYCLYIYPHLPWSQEFP